MPYFLTYSNNEYTCYSTDPTDAGIYDIEIDAYFNGKVVNSTKFVLNVTITDWNWDAPAFDKALTD